MGLIEELQAVRGAHEELCHTAAYELTRKSDTGEPRMRKVWFVEKPDSSLQPMFLYETHAQRWANQYGGTVQSQWIEWA